MSRGTVFWVLMILWFILALAGYFGVRWSLAGNSALTFVLFGLLGWKVFGPAIKAD